METPATDPRYTPNVPAVAFEAFDDEVVLIHFPSGRYFRLDDVGRAVWSAIGIPGGATTTAVAEALGVRFDGAPDLIATEVGSFVAALVENELVVEATEESAANDEAAPASADGPEDGAPKAPFAAPALEVFTDLEDILLLDPIHDVDETGWPHANPG